VLGQQLEQTGGQPLDLATDHPWPVRRDAGRGQHLLGFWDDGDRLAVPPDFAQQLDDPRIRAGIGSTCFGVDRRLLVRCRRHRTQDHHRISSTEPTTA
jgi:hypothetical protein